jgi:chromosome segregation ATPase
MDLMTWVGAAIACTLVILLAVVILSRRIDRVSEQLIDLRLLQINLQPTDNDQRRMVVALTALAEAIPDLRALRTEIEEIKQHQVDVNARMTSIAQAQGELHAMASNLDGIKTTQAELGAQMQLITQAHGEMYAVAGTLEEIKGAQGELSARLQRIAQADGELRKMTEALEGIKARQSESMNAVGGMANVIQQWCRGLNSAAAEVERTVRSVSPVISIETPPLTADTAAPKMSARAPAR